MQFYSNGKLLLTGEYLVLDGAKAFAVPTKYGQNLTVENIQDSEIIWESYTHNDQCWFQAVFDLKKLRLKTATFFSDNEGSSEFIAETLLSILKQAKRLNPEFLVSANGFFVKTKLTFPRNWGLGSSSTLINSIASWAKVDAFTLLWNSFKGSGYDIACAQNDSPLYYQIIDNKPLVQTAEFQPEFLDNLFFVYLNQKQDSKKGIAQYRENTNDLKGIIDDISQLTNEFTNAKTLSDLEKVIKAHEEIISKTVGLTPVKEQYFTDYFGAVKSLGAWGGDFVLATGNEHSKSYFHQKGFSTIIPYKEMVL